MNCTSRSQSGSGQSQTKRHGLARTMCGVMRICALAQHLFERCETARLCVFFVFFFVYHLPEFQTRLCRPCKRRAIDRPSSSQRIRQILSRSTNSPHTVVCVCACVRVCVCSICCVVCFFCVCCVLCVCTCARCVYCRVCMRTNERTHGVCRGSRVVVYVRMTERERARARERETDRQTERERERERVRMIHPSYLSNAFCTLSMHDTFTLTRV